MKRKDIEYEFGDKVFLKVSPWKKVLRFGKKEKLSPRFTGPYEVLERIRPVAYRLALPPKLAKLHDVFHVSMLRKYYSDESHNLPVQVVQVQQDFSYDEEPKAILVCEVKLFWLSRLVKVMVVEVHFVVGHALEEFPIHVAGEGDGVLLSMSRHRHSKESRVEVVHVCDRRLPYVKRVPSINDFPGNLWTRSHCVR